MKMKKNAGFSLIELMVVVGIIGILASLAIPRFQEFQAKARQTEAKTNLNYIATLQEAYFDDPVSGNTYFGGGGVTVNSGNCTAAQQGFGFSPAPCAKLAYSYLITSGAANTPTHLTTATEFNHGVFMCNTSNGDIWTIDQSRTLAHTGLGTSC